MGTSNEPSPIEPINLTPYKMTPQTLANYLGQEAIDKLGRKFTITGHTIDLVQNFPSHIGEMPKLLLTPLSKITDEDLKGLEERTRGLLDGTHLAYETMALVIDFLRSRGYAVGLKEDEYIDKTKV